MGNVFAFRFGEFAYFLFKTKVIAVELDFSNWILTWFEKKLCFCLKECLGWLYESI